MGFLKKDISRRQFIGGALALAAASAVPSFIRGAYKPTQSDSLQVWTCGGLSEAFLDLNQVYTMHTGHNIQYTGAFAGAIGKSLLAEKSRTEIFGARGLDLAKNMRKKGISIAFEPLCFTDYVIVTRKGNPAGIRDLKDMAEPGVRVMLPLSASPPGSASVKGVMKLSGLTDGIMKNLIAENACVISMMCDLVEGKADVSIIEKRLTTHDRFKDRIEYFDIPAQFVPPAPLTFTINTMKYVQDRALAADYIEFTRSQEGQQILENHGFTSVHSARGLDLIERFGVKDV